MKRENFPLDRPFYLESSVGGQMASRHIHNRMELYLLERGKCNYFIGNRSYTVRPGDLVIIPKGTFHRTNYEEESFRTVINCTSKYIPPSVISKLSNVIPLYRNEKTAEDIINIIEKRKLQAFR